MYWLLCVRLPDKLPGDAIRFPGGARLLSESAFKRPLLRFACEGFAEPNPRPFDCAPNPTFCIKLEFRSWPMSPFALRLRGGKSSAVLDWEDCPTAFCAPNLNPPWLLGSCDEELKRSSCCCCVCCWAFNCCCDDSEGCCIRMLPDGPRFRLPEAAQVDWLG